MPSGKCKWCDKKKKLKFGVCKDCIKDTAVEVDSIITDAGATPAQYRRLRGGFSVYD